VDESGNPVNGQALGHLVVLVVLNIGYHNEMGGNMLDKTVAAVEDDVAAFPVNALEGGKLFPGERIDAHFVEIGTQVERIRENKIYIGIRDIGVQVFEVFIGIQLPLAIVYRRSEVPVLEVEASVRGITKGCISVWGELHLVGKE